MSLPYRETLGRLLTSVRLNDDEREALRVGLAVIDMKVSPAEAARDVDVERDCPPSAPPSASRVASARRGHPWRNSAVPARRVPGGRE